MEKIIFKVLEEDAKKRIDKYLAEKDKKLSRTQIQNWIVSNNILLNGETCKSNDILKKNDEICITIPKTVELKAIPQKMDIEVVYEDSDLLVVNKPSGMVVHPGHGNYEGTLVNALLYYCNDLSGINGVLRPGIVHRIDKETSGLLVVCKNDFTHKNLSKQFADKNVTRKYIALVHGVIPHNSGKVNAPIGRSDKDRKMMAVVENGKNAITNFKVIKRYEKYTLVELILETGRTHQIRVHMKYIGFPVVGDKVYGPRKTIGEDGQFLHAKSLGFFHPAKKIVLNFDSDLPKYFNDFINQLK